MPSQKSKLLCLVYTMIGSAIIDAFDRPSTSGLQNQHTETISNENKSNLNCCRICKFKYEELDFVEDSANRYKSVRCTRIIRHSSLIRLLNCKFDIQPLDSHNLKPVHLCCSLFKIAFYSNFDDKHRNDSNGMSLQASQIKVELDWIIKVLEKIAQATICTGTESLLKIDNLIIMAGTNLNLVGIITTIYNCLPEFGRKYIVKSLACLNLLQPAQYELTAARNALSFAEMMASPYLFYGQFSKNTESFSKQHNSSVEIDMIITFINEKLRELYENTNDDPMQIIFIIHLMYNKNLKLIEVTKHNLLCNLTRSFVLLPDYDNFRKLICTLSDQATSFNRTLKHSHFSDFSTFIKQNDTTTLGLKIINFWIAKMVLHFSYQHVSFLCYTLFKENLMRNSTTWMVFFYSVLIKRLLMMTKKSHKCNFEKTASLKIRRKSIYQLFFTTYKDLRENIKSSFSQVQDPNKTDEMLELDKKSAIKTYNLFKHMYKIVVEIVNNAVKKQ